MVAAPRRPPSCLPVAILLLCFLPCVDKCLPHPQFFLCPSRLWALTAGFARKPGAHRQALFPERRCAAHSLAIVPGLPCRRLFGRPPPPERRSFAGQSARRIQTAGGRGLGDQYSVLAKASRSKIRPASALGTPWCNGQKVLHAAEEAPDADRWHGGRPPSDAQARVWQTWPQEGFDSFTRLLPKAAGADPGSVAAIRLKDGSVKTQDPVMVSTIVVAAGCSRSSFGSVEHQDTRNDDGASCFFGLAATTQIGSSTPERPALANPWTPWCVCICRRTCM